MGATNNFFDELAEQFDKVFQEYQNKKIVLYGLGLSTSTILTKCQQYNIIGIMDRSPDNIGELFCGKPILSKEEVIQSAEMIIINTDEQYWNIIFERIHDIQMPIFFRNGERALCSEKDKNNDGYRHVSRRELMNQIMENDVISFDIFDTLLARKIFFADDVFKMVETIAKEKHGISIEFDKKRKEAATKSCEYCNIHEIYENMRMGARISKEETEWLKGIEFCVEKKILSRREDVIKLFEYCISNDKEVVLTTDMYFPTDMMRELLEENDIKGYNELFVSCDIKKSKHKGDIYQYLKNKYQDKRILHIGDNYRDDYLMAKQNGLQAYSIMSIKEMAENSSLRDIIPNIDSLSGSVTMGMIAFSLFNSPYAYQNTKGRVIINNPGSWGYATFAPFLMGYCEWIRNRATQDGIEKLLFLLRDNYFVIDYFNIVQEQYHSQRKIPAELFTVSRTMVLQACIFNEEGFWKVAHDTFVGSLREYMHHRWGVDIGSYDDASRNVNTTDENDWEIIRKCILEFSSEIEQGIKEQKRYYSEYCKKHIKGNNAVVDFWLYGTAQYYLSVLAQHSIVGYYLTCDAGEGSLNHGKNKMCPYTKKEKASFLPYCRIFEGIFTAPYGTARKCVGYEQFEYDEKGNNQKYFSMRREIDEGIKEFILEYYGIMKCGKKSDVPMDSLFFEKLLVTSLKGAVDLSDPIKSKIFYDDFFWGIKEIPVLV